MTPLATRNALNDATAMIGRPLAASRWFTVDQGRIDAFANATEDWQFVHLDPERAAAETPYGGTVAHGFLTLGLLSAMAYDAQPTVSGMRLSVNYGFDRVRFVTPVRAGQRVRGAFTLAQAEARRPGELTLHWDARVEIEGVGTPAIDARWLTRLYLTKEDGDGHP